MKYTDIKKYIIRPGKLSHNLNTEAQMHLKPLMHLELHKASFLSREVRDVLQEKILQNYVKMKRVKHRGELLHITGNDRQRSNKGR